MLALLLALVAAAPAHADYRRLPGPPPDDDLAIARGVVIVGAGPSLWYHQPNGGVRTLTVPGRSRFVEEVNVSGSAVTVIALHEGGGSGAFYGPLAGPFKRFDERWIDVAVSGSRMIAMFRRGQDSGTLRTIDLRTGARRAVPVPGRGPRVIAAAGPYVSYMAANDTAYVRRGTREAYRVPVRALVTYRLAPDGRLVVFESTDGRDVRIRVATPARPRLRTIRRLGVASHDLAVTRDGVMLARGDARARSEVALLGWDGRLRAITPLLPDVGAIAWDGRTVAFQVGGCVFAGPVPAPGGPLPPVAAEGCTGDGAGR